jgi:hypothetical protein
MTNVVIIIILLQICDMIVLHMNFNASWVRNSEHYVIVVVLNKIPDMMGKTTSCEQMLYCFFFSSIVACFHKLFVINILLWLARRENMVTLRVFWCQICTVDWKCGKVLSARNYKRMKTCDDFFIYKILFLLDWVEE